MFVISRIEQYKFSDCAAVYAEAERTLARYDNPDWHPELVSNNLHLVQPSFSGGIEQYILSIKQKYKCRLSVDPTLPLDKQTNCFCQALFTASPEVFYGLTKDDIDQFFADCLSFFKSQFPSCEIVSAVIHYDESTPHLHISFLPLVQKENSRGKLKTVFSSSDLFKGKDFFVKYQDRFFDHMKSLYPELPLERKGEEKREHLTVPEFKEVQRKIDRANEELKEIEELKLETLGTTAPLFNAKMENT